MRDCVAGVIERLAQEFSPVVDPETVAVVAQQCLRDLDAEPEPALPELVERLARQRLGDMPVFELTPEASDGPATGSSARLVVHRDLRR
jgi:hypothetical protein